MADKWSKYQLVVRPKGMTRKEVDSKVAIAQLYASSPYLTMKKKKEYISQIKGVRVERKGWVGESTRHSMSAYGIKTGRKQKYKVTTYQLGDSDAKMTHYQPVEDNECDDCGSKNAHVVTAGNGEQFMLCNKCHDDRANGGEEPVKEPRKVEIVHSGKFPNVQWAEPKYKVIRYFAKSGRRKVMLRNVSRDIAQLHCNSPLTKKDGVYFDGMERM